MYELVNATEMLKKAKAGHYAVGQFNINNLEWTKAILLTAQELNSPVILGVSEGAGKYMAGYKTVVGMVKGMMEEQKITVPVALHLDHGSYEGCLKCVEAGFSSIMFDGSHYPIEENVAKTKELVKITTLRNRRIPALQTGQGRGHGPHQAAQHPHRPPRGQYLPFRRKGRPSRHGTARYAVSLS